MGSNNFYWIPTHISLLEHSDAFLSFDKKAQQMNLLMSVILFLTRYTVSNEI
jgi:hypothetical protein